MKSVFTFFLLLTIAIATAQPSNDECTGAMPLQLSAPTPCPNSTPVTNTFNVTNINATPTAPYPAFNMCTIGGQTSAPASEVWFTFVPTTNQLTITVSGGLATPNIVVFTGTNCGFLTGVQCARGAAPLSLTLPVVANQQYYLMVSGGSVSDQGNFTLSMTSFFDCNPCLQAANLVATPSPINGTYNSGQTVQFCYTITRWNTTGTIEWLHAIELEMGPGWDMSTFVPTPPPSCDGRGSWGWYNSWVSCATGRTFGPGFAYDSSRGVGCGGTANDGNPGNNWGDGDLNGGVNCANIGGNNGPPSVSFCWTVRVGDCPPNSTGNSLNVVVNVLSDGDSGSWTFTGCNSGVEYNFLASAVCCNDGNPNVSSTPATCSGVSNGTVTIAGFTAGDPYNYYIFNSSNQIVFSALGVIGPVTASNLPAGNYSIVAVNVLTNCQRTGSATIVNGPPPQATAGNGGPYCIGSQIQLQGGYTWSGTPSSVTYQWSGPGGFSSNQQNPTNATQPGTYNLIVSINGCPSPPVSTTVVINSVMAGATASPTTVCPQAPATLTASGGISYQWSTGQGGSSIVVNPTTTTTYTVTVTNATGCTATANVTVSVHTVPQLSLSGPPGGCAGELVIVSAVGGPFSQYQWSSGQTGNFIAPALTVPQSSFSVTATDPNGCTATANISIPVSSNPVLNVSALPASICEGTSSTLTASGATSYQWSTGDNGSSISLSPTSTTTYNVTASNAAGCLATSSVTVNVQPVPSLSITGPFNGCTGDVVVLSAVGGPFAQYQWSNGQTGSTAVVDLSPPMSNFSVTGITAGGCTVTANISISVSNNPVANATASLATICAGQSTTLSATGGVTYLWSTGAGTQNITVAPTATTTYQVTVTNQGGCTDVASVTVNVVQPIAAPVVSCGTATANSVTFSWPPVPNATGYTVNVLSGQSGTLSGTTYTVSGLAPGANVTIQVTALSGTICANTTTTFSCAPLSCPPVTVDIASPGSFCIGAGNPAISLTGNISGGAGNGTRNWSGPGIINAATGMFHPDTAGVGNHSIILTYTEGVCTYADTLTIAVRPVPTAAFTALPAIICNNASSTITYTGTATAGATYNWNFDGGTATPGTGPGPHSVSWATAGSKTITLTVTENGCTSAATSQTVQVDAPLAAPVISCGTSTTTSVVFNWGAVAGATGYIVNVISGPAGTLSGTSYTVTGLMPGQQVEIEVVAEGNTICGPVSAAFTCAAAACPVFNVGIGAVADICLTANTPVQMLSATVTGGAGTGTGLWSGPGITNPATGSFDPNIAGAGQHTITYTYTEGPCSQAATRVIRVFTTPSATFSASPLVVCTGQNAVLNFSGNAGGAATFAWNFDGGTATPGTGPGPHSVSWATAGSKTITLTVTENGCVSTPVNQMVQVDAPLAAPVINCATTTSEIVFSWPDVPGATGYTITVLAGPVGVQNGNTYTVGGLMPGDVSQIRVTALHAGPCGPSSAELSCTAQACPNVSMVIDPVAPICLSPNTPAVTLNAAISGGAGGGTAIWSGPGVAAGSNAFNPNTAGVGTHTISLSYTEGTCSFNSSITIVVHAIPGSTFSATGNICLTASAAVNYTGTATAGATYNWNFDGGTATPGTGPGPHSVSWATAGSKTITLTVTENGCTSAATSQTVQVDAPLAAPVISCGTSTTTSVVFNWGAVAGATGYIVNVISGPAGTLSGTSYTVTGLMPGQQVEIEVVAEGNTICGPVSAAFTCAAAACPVFNVGIGAVADICLTANTPVQMLSATVTGGAGTGTGLWSGPGITNPATGSFDPNIAGAGQHTITYTYAEGPCSQAATRVIRVFTTPSATFSASPLAVCTGQNAVLSFSGNAGGTATFAWNFDGGTATPGTGPGPHSVSWATAGSKTITLTVTENGCVSTPVNQMVQVDAPLAAPVINCATTTSEIVFSWPDVPGATGYTITVLAGPAGVQNGNTYTVGGLTPGDVSQIRVTALHAGPCGPSSAELSCTAQACPNVSMVIDPVAPICLSPNAPAVMLNAAISGGAGGGTAIWSGPGVAAGSNMFHPNTAGVGTHIISLSYMEGTCSFNSSITIVVHAIPGSTFSATGNICLTASAAVNYTGTATAGATYNWNFDGGTATPGTGPGPHSVSWATAGSKTITLTVTENGCTSTTTSQMVQVDAPLAAPVINCATTTSEIVFSWPDVPGATGYTVTVLAGPAGVQNGNTYTVGGLTPGDVSQIRVTALHAGPCGPSSAELSCTAQACPNVSMVIDPVAPICLSPNTPAVTLNAAISGGAGGGTAIWSGPGVAAGSNMFNPNTAGVGTHTISLSYMEGNCSYNASTTITVIAQPVAGFAAPASVCVGTAATLTFNGTAPAGADYSWNFGGGTAVPGNGQGPHDVTWSTGGAKTVSLVVGVNNCLSLPFQQTIQVDAPLAAPQITCSTTTTSITFSWAAVPGATGYQAVSTSGPQGVLNGTSYTVSGLLPNESVTAQVTALGGGACGNSAAEVTCIAQNCPGLALSFSGTQAICAGDPAQVTFNFAGSGAGPFAVTYSINGGPAQTGVFTNGQSLPITATATTTIAAISITDNSLPSCMYPSSSSWTIVVNPPVSAGTPAQAARLCAGANTALVLSDLLEGETPGGIWSETSVQPSVGGAFNATVGTFTASGQAARTYTFQYTVQGAAPCPAQQAVVTVILEPAPQADAGADQTLTCNMGMVSIGGNATTVGQGISYMWSSTTPGVVIADPAARIIEVAQPGTYVLTVRNGLGCTATDEVVVTADFAAPVAQVEVSPISCFQAGDGTLRIAGVSGGQAPYQYSLDGGSFGSQLFFAGLGAGRHTLVVRDRNGCFSELNFVLDDPQRLVVNIRTNLNNSENLIQRGDSVQLEAAVTGGAAINSVSWKPDSVSQNTTVIRVQPRVATTYSVTVVDANGCRAEDQITIYVEYDRRVFIPNAFSPNGDGLNDVFGIFADNQQVVQVRSFLVFNRWGETMFELYNFIPNNPSLGWNGSHRDKLMNTGVYVYMAEVEFTDGEVILYRGDVLLTR